MKLRNSHHIAHLGILVRLGSEKWFAVGHFNRFLGSLFKSFKVSEIGTRIDKSTADGVGISSDGSDNAHTGSLGLGHVVQQQVDKKEMSKVIHTHRHFETIIRPGRFWISRSVYGSVTDKVGQGAGRLEGLEVRDKVSDALKTGEFQLHDGVRIVWETIVLGNCKNTS